jgi:predicted Zn-dependent protease
VEATRARNEWLAAAEGEIALAGGDPSAAAPLLERALPALMADVTVTPAQMYRAAETLAEALTALGRYEEAAQTLEMVLGRRERETFAGGPYWAHRCAMRLKGLRGLTR